MPHNEGVMPEREERKHRVVVVDDDPYVLGSLSMILMENGYSVTACSGAAEAMDFLRKRKADVVLTDIRMPGLSGIDLLAMVHEVEPEIPVILMTAYAEFDVAVDAIKKGAFDFIIKPYKAEHLLFSLDKAAHYSELLLMEKNYKSMLEDTVQKKTKELSDALTMVSEVSSEIIRRLTTVAEFRDIETGFHISRIGEYAGRIAASLGMEDGFVDTITFASPMHDIGKVGIPDHILLKPEQLNRKECSVMMDHTTIGEKILSGSTYPSIRMAATIALTHHERWDGSGYPRGLKGEEIPVEGRIVMLADQYDALRSRRPYRGPLSHEETVRVIVHGDGRTLPEHFDPAVRDVFLELESDFDEIFSARQH